MSDGSASAAALRVRAARCREYAREYATELSGSLLELAVELDGRADRLEADQGCDALLAPDMPLQQA